MGLTQGTCNPSRVQRKGGMERRNKAGGNRDGDRDQQQGLQPEHRTGGAGTETEAGQERRRGWASARSKLDKVGSMGWEWGAE